MDCTSCFREMDAKQEPSHATFWTMQGKKSCLNMLDLLLLKRWILWCFGIHYYFLFRRVHHRLLRVYGPLVISRGGGMQPINFWHAAWKRRHIGEMSSLTPVPEWVASNFFSPLKKQIFKKKNKMSSMQYYTLDLICIIKKTWSLFSQKSLIFFEFPPIKSARFHIRKRIILKQRSIIKFWIKKV